MYRLGLTKRAAGGQGTCLNKPKRPKVLASTWYADKGRKPVHSQYQGLVVGRPVGQRHFGLVPPPQFLYTPYRTREMSIIDVLDCGSVNEMSNMHAR